MSTRLRRDVHTGSSMGSTEPEWQVQKDTFQAEVQWYAGLLSDDSWG
ncbi:hypothetical protein IG631_14603 [Alternaria alternata]|nr:hypothetical protein IG631_14603 [Alternaria alternata]